MAKQKTLYYLPTYGQLGNQLAVLAHLLAFSLEYGYTIVYPQSNYFSKHIDFSGTKHARIQFNKLFANPVFAFGISKVIKLIFLNQNSPVFRYLIINKKFTVENDFDKTKQPDVIIVTDWLFRFYTGIKKHQDALRKQLAFTSLSVEKAHHKWLSLQAQYPDHTFIGIHVRRGDYATFLGGKYFFDDATYYTWLTQMATQTEKPVFIVCSNEELHFENKQNLNIVYTKGSPSEDLYILSHCRYILGPPSTFASWAAFLGDQYLMQPEHKNAMIQMADFRKYYL